MHIAYGKVCQLVLLSLSLRLGYCTNSRCFESPLYHLLTWLPQFE